MNNSANRVARITSSKVSLLLVEGRQEMGFGAGAITYLNNKKKELEFGRGLDLPIYKQDMIWGKAWETYVHWQLGNEYELVIDKTTIHPKHIQWSGSQDFNILNNGVKIGISELKCYQMSNHFDYVKVLLQQNVEVFKKEYASEYWQIVSNCIIHGVNIGEAIAFMPTEQNLLEMRDMVENTDYIEKHLKDDAWKYRFLYEKDLYDLPFIPKHSDFPSMVKFRFEVPVKDMVLLTKKVTDGIKYLNQ
jgi:hypothetical protein